MNMYRIQYKNGLPFYIIKMGECKNIEEFKKEYSNYDICVRTMNFKVPAITKITKEEAQKGEGIAFYIIHPAYDPAVYIADEDVNFSIFRRYYKIRG